MTREYLINILKKHLTISEISEIIIEKGLEKISDEVAMNIKRFMERGEDIDTYHLRFNLDFMKRIGLYDRTDQGSSGIPQHRFNYKKTFEFYKLLKKSGHYKKIELDYKFEDDALLVNFPEAFQDKE